MEIPAGEQVNRDSRRGTSQQRFPQGGQVDRDFCRKGKSVEIFAGGKPTVIFAESRDKPSGIFAGDKSTETIY